MGRRFGCSFSEGRKREHTNERKNKFHKIDPYKKIKIKSEFQMLNFRVLKF
jgi:hypothetical protein